MSTSVSISLFGLFVGISVLAVGYGRVGQRRRRRSFIIAGWTILGLYVWLLGLFVYQSLSGRIDWISLKPASWLFRDVESGSWRQSRESYDELVRRLEAGELDEQDLEQFTRDAIDRYSSSDPRMSTVDVRAVQALRKAGRLSPEQVAPFFQGLVKLEMKAKGVVSADEPVPVRIAITPQADWSECGLWCVVTVKPVTTSPRSDIDQSAVQWSTPRVRFGRYSSIYGNEIDASVPKPHEGVLIIGRPTFAWWLAEVSVAGIQARDLRCDVRIDYFDGEPDVDRAARPFYTTTEQLSATSIVSHPSIAAASLTVDSRPTPELVGPRSNATPTDPLYPRCQIQCHAFSVVPDVNGNTLRIRVDIRGAKPGFAFDASLMIDGTVHAAGTICHAEGESRTWVLTAPYPGSAPETIDLTLTPNVDLASGCVDLPEIWGNAITFKDVPRNRPIILRPGI